MTTVIADRLRAVDPVLLVLSTSTLISTLGRGVFLTVSVLYLNFVVHLPASQIAIVLGAASVAGIGFSLVGGQLSDRVSARRLLLVGTGVGGLGLVSYAFVGGFWPAVLIFTLTGAADAIGHSARAAIIARAFTGATRVNTRAILRTLTNIGIAIGSGLSAITLAVGSPFAFRLSLVLAGLVYLAGQVNLVRLPSWVDAPGTSGSQDPVSGAGPLIDETALAAGQIPLLPEHAQDGVKATRRASHSPWRDGRFLMFALLTGIFGVQFSLAEIGVPLWVAHETVAPRSIISILLICNTIIVIAFTVRLSRNTHRMRIAGWASVIAGVLMLLACLGYASAQSLGVVAACAVLIVGAVSQAFAEVLSQASLWGMSFELADPVQAGAYQGVVGTTFSLGSAIGPGLVAVTALALGFGGWVILGGILLAAALGTAGIAFRAARLQPELA